GLPRDSPLGKDHRLPDVLPGDQDRRPLSCRIETAVVEEIAQHPRLGIEVLLNEGDVVRLGLVAGKLPPTQECADDRGDDGHSSPREPTAGAVVHGVAGSSSTGIVSTRKERAERNPASVSLWSSHASQVLRRSGVWSLGLFHCSAQRAPAWHALRLQMRVSILLVLFWSGQRTVLNIRARDRSAFGSRIGVYDGDPRQHHGKRDEEDRPPVVYDRREEEENHAHAHRPRVPNDSVVDLIGLAPTRRCDRMYLTHSSRLRQYPCMQVPHVATTTRNSHARRTHVRAAP